MIIGYTSQLNGVSERKNKIVMEMAKSMLFEKGLLRSFWGEAINTTIYLINRCPTKALNNQTLFEAWSSRKPLMNHLKVFRCVCYAQILKEKRYKLEETSVRYIFLGYSSMSKGYRLYNLKTKKVLISRDVLFDEKAEGKIEGDGDLTCGLKQKSV